MRSRRFAVASVHEIECPSLSKRGAQVLALRIAAGVDERLELLVRDLVLVDQVVAGGKLQGEVVPRQTQRERPAANEYGVRWDRSAHCQRRKRPRRRAGHFDCLESILLELPAEHAARDPGIAKRRTSEMLPCRRRVRVRFQVDVHAIGIRGDRPVNDDTALETRQPWVLRSQALDFFQARERRDVVIGVRQLRGFRDQRVDATFIAAALQQPRDRDGGRHQRHDRRHHCDAPEG